jgi:hypothetical protein
MADSARVTEDQQGQGQEEEAMYGSRGGMASEGKGEEEKHLDALREIAEHVGGEALEAVESEVAGDEAEVVGCAVRAEFGGEAVGEIDDGVEGEWGGEEKGLEAREGREAAFGIASAREPEGGRETEEDRGSCEFQGAETEDAEAEDGRSAEGGEEVVFNAFEAYVEQAEEDTAERKADGCGVKGAE